MHKAASATPSYYPFTHSLSLPSLPHSLLHFLSHLTPSHPPRVTLQTEIERVQQMLGNLGGDEANLEVKIENKRQELERNQKRLRSLANVR